MRVRKAVLNDSAGIARVQVDSWRTTYRGIIPDSFLDRLSYKKQRKLWNEGIRLHHVFVAENRQGEIVGFVSGGPNRFPDLSDAEAEIFAIYLLQDYQRQGIGKQLLKPLVEEFRRVNWNSVMVLALEDNPAKMFYERIGATKIGTTEVEIEGKKLKEAIYVWKGLDEFRL